jgi:hypothetical protein
MLSYLSGAAALTGRLPYAKCDGGRASDGWHAGCKMAA